MQSLPTPHDDRLRLVMILHFIGGMLSTCATVFFSYVIISSAVSNSGAGSTSLGDVFAVTLGVLLALALGVSPLLSAIFISKRTFLPLSTLVSFFFLPFFPVGTLFGIYSLWVLTSPATKLIYSTP